MDQLTGNPTVDNTIWITRVALVVGGAVWLLKTNRFNALLARLTLKPVPRHYLPWLSIALGVASMALEAKLRGANWEQALFSAFYGVFAGALAIAGDSAPVATAKRMKKAKAQAAFEKA